MADPNEIGKIEVKTYSNTVDDKTRFGVEVVVEGEAAAAEIID